MKKPLDISRLADLLLEELIGGFSDLYPDSDEGEHVKAAAVRLANGDIVTGDHHDMAYSRLPRTLANQRDQQNHEEGFVTNLERFVTRKEAMEIARRQQQIRKERDKRVRPDTSELDSFHMLPRG